MVELAQNTDELYDLELEDSDKEDVLQFILGKRCKWSIRDC